MAKTQRHRRRIVWIAGAGLAAALLAGGLFWRWVSSASMQPWQFLAHVEQIESAGVDGASVQPLGWSLTILGRDDEVRRLDMHPQFTPPPSQVDVTSLPLECIPWREGIAQIATAHRVVMIMESHIASKHREFIGATLGLFHEAGYSHYAAEAIGPLDANLQRRGYPTSRTGLYTCDPRFGNVIRRALTLEFAVIGYDFRSGNHEEREAYAADRLGQVLEDPQIKLLVHAGHAHVLKHTTFLGERWLAARLWEQTRIEPFTIWQWSSGHDAKEYEAVAGVLAERGLLQDEPVLLMPPPDLGCGWQDAPWGLAEVDALVVHPPDQSEAPAQRTVLFQNDMQRKEGRWTGGVWPVVVAAYRAGEPAEAIPLDQVMLRPGESDFRLWIPDGEKCEYRVFDSGGEIDGRIEEIGDPPASAAAGRNRRSREVAE